MGAFIRNEHKQVCITGEGCFPPSSRPASGFAGSGINKYLPSVAIKHIMLHFACNIPSGTFFISKKHPIIFKIL